MASIHSITPVIFYYLKYCFVQLESFHLPRQAIGLFLSISFFSHSFHLQPSSFSLVFLSHPPSKPALVLYFPCCLSPVLPDSLISQKEYFCFLLTCLKSSGIQQKGVSSLVDLPSGPVEELIS